MRISVLRGDQRFGTIAKSDHLRSKKHDIRAMEIKVIRDGVQVGIESDERASMTAYLTHEAALELLKGLLSSLPSAYLGSSEELIRQCRSIVDYHDKEMKALSRVMGQS